MRSPFFLRLIFAVFFVLFSIGPSFAGGNPVSAKNRDSKHDFIRKLPDMKVLLEPGSSLTTTVDLRKAYGNLGEVEPQLSLAENGKSDVVQAELQSEVLQLHWKGLGTSQIVVQIVDPKSGHVFFDRVRLEAWAPRYTTMFFTVLGGLGLLLLGMKFMSDGLQAVAGPSLRKLVATVTDNRFSAVLVGVAVTSLIQSSSVTTVMVVSFINSQIMTFTQGIGVIMGANIGTTITAWLMSLDIAKYGLPLLGAAGCLYLFTSVERTRLLSMAAMGLGFVFFGLQLMQSGFVPLRDLPEFSVWLESFSADTFGGILLCVFAGCILTLIVHSSSAMVGITISLAAIGLISFESAAALVLGENIGTTITAVMASFGTTTNARRAAYFHVLFNVTGVCWAVLIFRPVFIPVVTWIVGIDPTTGLIRDPKIGVAVTHTLFNSINTILFLAFTGTAAKFLIRIVPESKDVPDGKARLTTLGKGRLDHAALAIEQSRVEILRMGDICTNLTDEVSRVCGAAEPDEKTVESAFHGEAVLDSFQDEIIEFATELLSHNISHEIAESARQQLRMADELESISDYLIVIMKSDLKLKKDGLALPEPQKSELKELHAALAAYISFIIRFYAERKTNQGDLMTEVHVQGRSFTKRVKAIRNLFIKRMSEEKFDPQIVIAFNTQLNAYRRAREHALNVAEAVAGIK